MRKAKQMLALKALPANVRRSASSSRKRFVALASWIPMPCTAKHSGPRAILGSPCFNIRYLFPGLTQGNMPWAIESQPKLEPQSDTKNAFFQLGMRPSLRCLHNSSHMASSSRGNNKSLVASRNSASHAATSSSERPLFAWNLGC